MFVFRKQANCNENNVRLERNAIYWQSQMRAILHRQGWFPSDMS